LAEVAAIGAKDFEDYNMPFRPISSTLRQ